MLRSTDSRIIYLQQLGRALSSDKTREQTIVFDLVNNYLKNNLDREINDKSKREISIERKEKETEQVEKEENDREEDIDIFRIQGETKEFLELFEEINGELGQTYLINARKIKAWMEERETTKPPSRSAKELGEKKLGTALKSIRQELIKPYIELKTEEEKEKYRTNHPELEEVLEIIKWIDENNLSPYLVNARDIKKWMERKKTTKPPSKNVKEPEEKRLGNALFSIRQKLLKPYIGLKTEEEREKFRANHPELEEVQEIVKWIDENNLSPYLVNARDIKKWMEEKGTTKPPSRSAKDLKEIKLGRALFTIRQILIKPYLELKTEEEKAKYKEKHPELEEVLQIVTEIDLNSGNKNRQELALLIRQDEEAREKVEEARKLEAQYEQQQKGQGIDTGENYGKQ